MNAKRYDDAVDNLRETTKWLVGSIGAIFVIVLAGVQFNDIPFATDPTARTAGAIAGVGLMITFGLAIATLVGGSVSFDDLATRRRLWLTRRFINRTLRVPDQAEPLEQLRADLESLRTRVAKHEITDQEPTYLRLTAQARFLVVVARWHIVKTRFLGLVVAMMLLIPVELIAAGIMVSARAPDDGGRTLTIELAGD